MMTCSQIHLTKWTWEELKRMKRQIWLQKCDAVKYIWWATQQKHVWHIWSSTLMIKDVQMTDRGSVRSSVMSKLSQGMTPNSMHFETHDTSISQYPYLTFWPLQSLALASCRGRCQGRTFAGSKNGEPEKSCSSSCWWLAMQENQQMKKISKRQRPKCHIGHTRILYLLVKNTLTSGNRKAKHNFWPKETQKSGSKLIWSKTRNNTTKIQFI